MPENDKQTPASEPKPSNSPKPLPTEPDPRIQQVLERDRKPEGTERR